MAINFSPGNFVGDTLREGGKTWTWDGQKWNLSGSSIGGNFVLRTGDVMTGSLSIEVEATEDKHAVTKDYVDRTEEGLRQDIIELEEEIDAIAPSVEYGTWEWSNPTNNTVPPAPGTFYLLDENGDLTDLYEDVEYIKIHNEEYVPAGSTDPVDKHTWAEADDQKLIQLFDAADPDFFLGTIVSKTIETDFVLIEVAPTQTSGVPNNNADPATGDYLTRINIFNAPTGGSVSEFVKKIGDEMTGTLTFENSFESGEYDHTNVKAKLTFENTKSNNTKSYIHLFRAGNVSSLMSNGSFISEGGLYTSTYFYGWNKTTNSVYPPRINIDANYGYLRYNSSEIFVWGSAGAACRTNFYLSDPGARIVLKSGNNSSTGSSGQVLTSGGSGSPPRWSDPSGGVKITCNTQYEQGAMWYCTTDQTLYIRV